MSNLLISFYCHSYPSWAPHKTYALKAAFSRSSSLFSSFRCTHSGVCYTSYRRPIVNMRPKYRISSMGVPWQFPADLSIVAWLENQKYDYEILTDEDLHIEGVDALKSYKCVLSGTHGEYYSERMLDATEDYIAGGGRYIYMGGNGYYWNVAFREDEPWIMEVWKLDSGMRAWSVRPGEHYLATTGQKSGLWKNLGRPPQKLVGIGFIAEGFLQLRLLAGCSYGSSRIHKLLRPVRRS